MCGHADSFGILIDEDFNIKPNFVFPESNFFHYVTFEFSGNVKVKSYIASDWFCCFVFHNHKKKMSTITNSFL